MESGSREQTRRSESTGGFSSAIRRKCVKITRVRGKFDGVLKDRGIRLFSLARPVGFLLRHS